ncbi:unnamed protein product [Acanthoscelides obtectus]|uniref:Ig-like domain-containing protein n=1 Tax=Acanthoscelides obtectus TaxID=200917 RepID=A0A9P0Q7I3_ACAOB|nr:unnamed protein product [Acanthoscelides obtectus]CAK1685869.1 hypothetical protein AOBTE_LOCUS35681 [Acanthoscelides obtectus]
MGAYLCIATNGVPPSVSKRIIVDVEWGEPEHGYHYITDTIIPYHSTQDKRYTPFLQLGWFYNFQLI